MLPTGLPQPMQTGLAMTFEISAPCSSRRLDWQTASSRTWSPTKGPWPNTIGTIPRVVAPPFMVPIAQRMATALECAGMSAVDQLKHIERNRTGNDLDSVLLNLSRSFLDVALYGLIEHAAYRPCFRLFEGDGLTSGKIELLRPDVIACNPPYRKLKADELLDFRRKHGNVIEGQPNIYGLFINDGSPSGNFGATQLAGLGRDLPPDARGS